MYITTKLKNDCLRKLSVLIDDNRSAIINANQKDINASKNLDATLLDRLKVDDQKINGMIRSLEEVTHHDDPIGKVLYETTHANGMQIVNKVVPFGKILIIYESRPDVTIEAAASAFKAGSSILLKGGKEARNSNLVLVKLWHEALSATGLQTEWVQFLDVDRKEMQQILESNKLKADLIIPRGGEALINYIRSQTDIPLMISGRGNNFLYVHSDANPEMAINLIKNGKSRLSVCNAIDKVLLNRNLSDEFFDQLLNELTDTKPPLELYRVGERLSNYEHTKPMPSQDMWKEEFLSSRLLLAEVSKMEQAVEMINEHSGGHTAVIVTENDAVAEAFQYGADCAAVYHNASSRFTDGGEFGFGAEIAISTQKIHFRGPVGLHQLVTNKWFVKGNGQTR